MENSKSIIGANGTERIHGYSIIQLENKQIILTNGKETYCIDNYDAITIPREKIWGIMQEGTTTAIVDIKENKIVFSDENVLVKDLNDNRFIIIKDNKVLYYSTLAKKYLPIIDGYIYSYSLNNQLFKYSDREEAKSERDITRGIIINANGEIIADVKKDTTSIYNDHLVLVNEEEKVIRIITDYDTATPNTTTLNQEEGMIYRPLYSEGKIVKIYQDAVRVYDLDLNLIKEIKLKKLEEIRSASVIKNVLKFEIGSPTEDIRHFCINLENGKTISHKNIEGFSIDSQNTLVGQDIIDAGWNGDYAPPRTKKTYYFYDSGFNPIAKIAGVNFSPIQNTDNIFEIDSADGPDNEIIYINNKGHQTSDSKQIILPFIEDGSYGIAYNIETEKLDIINQEFSPVISGINQKDLNMNLGDVFFADPDFFILNNYVCLLVPTIIYDHTYLRSIVLNSEGEVLIDKMNTRCYPLGNLIQIGKTNEVINSLTGEIGKLCVIAATDENGKIDFNQEINLTTIQSEKKSGKQFSKKPNEINKKRQ